MLDINLIQVFLEVAKTGSISRASKNLRVTQPGISQKIKLLEAHLGESLFNRRRSGMELNESGKEFLSICTDLKQNLDYLEAWSMNKKGRIKGHIHVSTISGFINYIFPKFMKRFLKKYPDVKVSVDVGVSAFVEEDVLKARSDVGVIIADCKRESLRIQRLCGNKIFMVCSPNYYLAKKKRVTKKDLEKARILMHADTHSRSVKALSTKLGFSSEKELGDVFLNDMEACKAHAVEGIGVAFVANMHMTAKVASRNGAKWPVSRSEATLAFLS